MDVEKLRQDFPVLQKETAEGKGKPGQPLIYFDNACMSLKPRQVVEAMNEYYDNFPACAGRSVHRLSNRVEDARQVGG